jgi:lipopolysaccharide export LptBFGC system permease protein LptF
MLLAQDLDSIQTGAFGRSKLGLDLGELIGDILPYIFAAASIGLLVYLVLGGFQFMTSRGDPKAAQGAQGKITNAIIGFIIVIFAYVIVQLFGQVFGLQGTPFGQIFSLK